MDAINSKNERMDKVLISLSLKRKLHEEKKVKKNGEKWEYTIHASHNETVSAKSTLSPLSRGDLESATWLRFPPSLKP